MLPVWASDERILRDVHGCALGYVCCCVTSDGFLYSVYGAVGRRCLVYCTVHGVLMSGLFMYEPE
jgi:hypothetical protein